MAYFITRSSDSIEEAQLIADAVEDTHSCPENFTYATVFCINYVPSAVFPFLIWFKIDDEHMDEAWKRLYTPGSTKGPELDKKFFETRIDRAIKSVRKVV